MTKKYFIQLADYNIWANDIVHSWFEKITDEQWKQPIVSSFKSIEETTLHVISSEKSWLDRLNLVQAAVWSPADFKVSKKEAQEIWRETSQGLKTFADNFDETKLADNVSYKRMDGNTYQLPYYQVLSHVFNHSTYHRGQIVTMLRQTGFTEVSSTDMSGYYKTINN